MPLQYDDERRERRDYEYMKSLYPETAKKILPYVEEECDRMGYQNSMIYDEYPDRLQLMLMCRRIYDNVRKQEKIFYGNEFKEIAAELGAAAKADTAADRRADTTMDEQGWDEPESEWEQTEILARAGIRINEVEEQASRKHGGPQPGRPQGTGRPPQSGRPQGTGRPPQPGRPQGPGRPQQPSQNQNWLQNLIEVMLYNELFKRRCDNRRCSHRIY